MITKIDNAVLVYVDAKPWKMEGREGITYPAKVYSEKTIVDCKASKEIYEAYKNQELINGTAVIEIEKTNYSGKEKVNYLLKEFVNK